MATRTGVARRSVVALTVALVLAFAVAIGVRVIWPRLHDQVGAGCTFGRYRTDTAQAATAATMAAVVVGRGLPQRAAVLVLAAGLQESKLRNIPNGQGDRDSVGVLQQRPSQGWGTAAQLSDVRFATGAFLDALIKDTGWQAEPLAKVIQQVQISADGTAYARHEAQATAMAAALTGSIAKGISCTFPAPTRTAAATTVGTQLAHDLPVNPPTVAGRTVSVSGAKWATAAWLVANADRLGIEEVAYAGQRWARSAGWKTAAPTTPAVTATVHP